MGSRKGAKKMKLTDLLKGLSYQVLQQGKDAEISDVCYDTRHMKQDAVFVCIRGAKLDSHAFAVQAAEAGAAALVVEEPVEVSGVTVVQVPDTRIALAVMSAAYFGHPALKLKTIGITGSKGKTTATYMVKAILDQAGKKAGLIGSIGALIGEEKVKTINTTPESYELQKLFYRMAETGCEYVVMEVSSQGLKLSRTAGFVFDYGIFLNISRDHISPWEHATLEEYLECKSRLFRQCKVGLINVDDKKHMEILAGHTCQVETFGFSPEADVQIVDYHNVSRPGYMGIGYRTKGKVELEMTVGSPGEFSAYDSLAAALACLHFGIPQEAVCHGLEHIKIRGRVETVDIPAPYTVILDFAHNGIGVENLIRAVRQYQPNRVLAVFGSDGNRTKIRRADAGEILGNMADFTVVTSNSPRFEPLEEINAAIKEGLDRTTGKYVEIPDRRDAIRYAMKMAQPGDMVLLIGKGHWDTEDINGVKYPFDERVVVKELYRELEGQMP